jgi:hypothetical protein
MPLSDDDLLDELLEGSSGDDWSLGEHTPREGGGGSSARGSQEEERQAERQAQLRRQLSPTELVSHPPDDTPWRSAGAAMETPMPGMIRCSDMNSLEPFLHSILWARGIVPVQSPLSS